MQEENIGNVIFISRLREGMNCNALTQNQLGNISNISQSTISSYLIGRTAPKSDELHRLSNALGVTMGWLWGEEDTSATESGDPTNDLLTARKEITRLKNKLQSARKTLEGAYKLALEALIVEEAEERK